MDINWGILANAANPAQIAGAVQQGFQSGQAQARQNQLDNALRYLGKNSDDPQAMNALMEADPMLGMRFREDQTRRKQAGLEAHREAILKGAQLVRQINPQDEAGWQQVLATAKQIGLPLQDVPTNFDPQYVRGLISAAEAFSPQKEAQPTSMERNYQFLQDVNPQLAQNYLKSQAEGAPLIASNGDGTFTIIPRGNIGGTQPVPSTPAPVQADADALRRQAQEAIAAGADPEAVNARLEQMLGGAGSSSPRPFPQ